MMLSTVAMPSGAPRDLAICWVSMTAVITDFVQRSVQRSSAAMSFLACWCLTVLAKVFLPCPYSTFLGCVPKSPGLCLIRNSLHFSQCPYKHLLQGAPVVLPSIGILLSQLLAQRLAIHFHRAKCTKDQTFLQKHAYSGYEMRRQKATLRLTNSGIVS